ncbi:MAG: V-type ATP synthase subunit F [Huintestinicola sp.]|uniref:V-type ATP synthase subunit F n=1 Tax=Huintestinicola sp. TaxID=2981661 RepID=UPI003EFF0AD3
MKFFLLSDNVDTVTGMRLAGIEGVVVHKAEETEKALLEAMDNKDIAVILMTEKLIDLIEDKVNELKLTRSSPIISEIPDRHATVDVTASISRYVQEAIGIKL